jgi:predicted acyltransferase
MPSSLATSSPVSGRLQSIDVFRGATIVAMILVNDQFSTEKSYHELTHAAWNGWTFADAIYPTFLFVVGVSIALSTASRTSRRQGRSQQLSHAIRRALLIFGCGVLIEYVRFPSHEFLFLGVQPHFQITGVLQKIAICYLVSSVIFLSTGLRGVIVGIVSLHLLYLGLLYFYPVPGCGPGSLTEGCNFPGYLDEMLLDGFRWNSSAFDPEGLGAILSAITSVMFGVVAGQIILRKDLPQQERLFRLLGGGVALIAAGELLSTWVPINKHLWTTSFAVLMAGLSATGLAGSIWLVDKGPLRSCFRPLEILGLNAIAAYLISRLLTNVPRIHIFGKSLYDDILSHLTSPPNASLLFAIIVLVAVYLIIWLMDRGGWYLKV